MKNKILSGLLAMAIATSSIGCAATPAVTQSTEAPTTKAETTEAVTTATATTSTATAKQMESYSDTMIRANGWQLTGIAKAEYTVLMYELGDNFMDNMNDNVQAPSFLFTVDDDGVISGTVTTKYPELINLCAYIFMRTAGIEDEEIVSTFEEYGMFENGEPVLSYTGDVEIENDKYTLSLTKKDDGYSVFVIMKEYIPF